MMAIRKKLAAIRQSLFGDSARAFGTLSVVLLLCWRWFRPGITSASGIAIRKTICG